MTKISDIGEFGFIDAIKEIYPLPSENVAVGTGDDGARPHDDAGLAAGSRHRHDGPEQSFNTGQTATWHDVGFKAVASNLSDIAAMGAVPTHIVLSTARHCRGRR